MKQAHHTLLLALAAVFFVAPQTLAQSTTELDRTVQQVVRDQAMSHGMFSVSVYNMATGKAVYRHNADMSLTPASVAKLFTTGVGFARLGSDFRFVTKLALQGRVDRDGVLHGSVYLCGGGDPMLGSYRYRQTTPDTLFHSWTHALKNKGIRRIYGRVCYNSSVFDEQPLHDSWQWGDVGNYYASGVSGLNFHENMYFVYFNPGKRLGEHASVVRTQPKNVDIHGICEVTTGPEGSGDNVVIYGGPTSKDRLYRGTVPLGRNNFAVRGALPNPAKSCADLFSTYLRTHGISISTTTLQVQSLPDSLRPVLDYYSSPYYAIAQYTNLTSNNLYAESIFKYLGYKAFGNGSFDNGARAVESYFKEKGLETGGVRIVDGSGLSRLNRTTTDFLCRYLQAMYREPFFDKYLQSLPKAGESGTARNIMPSLPKGVTVRVKTGTMDGVKAYAGYVVTRTGDTYSFAIVSNGHECSEKEVAAKMGLILQKIATLGS